MNLARVLRLNRRGRLLKGQDWHEDFRFQHPVRLYRRVLARPVSVLRLDQSGRKDAQVAVEESRRTGFLEGLGEAVLIAVRVVVITSVITGLTVVYLFGRVTGLELFPVALSKGMEFLGPIFVKLGQWASTRQDIFPEEIRHALSRLQRTAAAHSWFYTRHLLEAAYGDRWRRSFVRFEAETPIGSGCCAQVYKAWLDPDTMVEVRQQARVPFLVEMIERLSLGRFAARLDGMIRGEDEIGCRDGGDARKLRPVAVKVLHPGIKSLLKRDLSILRGICRCATYVAPDLHWLNLNDCIDEFSRIMEDQVDLKLEAANLIRFGRNFSGTGSVSFPRPYASLAHDQILVESYHEGRHISDYLDSRDEALQRELARTGVRMILKMVFRDNFIHCDLHPGNILVEMINEEPGPPDRWTFMSLSRRIKPNTEPKTPTTTTTTTTTKTPAITTGRARLIVLDCGLAVSLDQCRRQNLRDVFRSVLLRNGELTAEYILEYGRVSTSDQDGFKSSMRRIVEAHTASSLHEVSLSTVVAELFSAMVRHRVRQDGYFSSVILSMAVIEGLGRALDPNIDIFAEALPYVLRPGTD